MSSVPSAKLEVKVTVLQTAKSAPIPDNGYNDFAKSEGRICLTSDTSCKFGGPMASFRFDNSLE